MTSSSNSPIRVALVDDQELLRTGFRMVIDSQPDLEVVAEAADGVDAVQKLLAISADVVLMDVRMPRLDGIETTKRLLAEQESGRMHEARIVMLTTFDLDEYALAAIKAGASGFLLKDAQPEDLLAAIRTVHSGDAVIAPSTTRRLLDHVAPMLVVDAAPDDGPGRLGALTHREQEVLREMAHGLSNGEIAAKFYLSEATVKTHVGRILSKLDVRDRVQAVVVAYETRLVVPGE
ncbi:response regulator [Spelaeicoccus albus]|uniref:DNA-binding NarL/FixJ family response regulator n=1 Tax=Spelaeicoccus albus TaxID=1280376 RepID=A0A7Z0D2M1_9MICO|nr:response regulator transcription factor [Spelaeicoccus albus]NYI67688.1 DNA-binding NarL/FixJ family response regulator [Spelaeicoccus albus]